MTERERLRREVLKERERTQEEKEVRLCLKDPVYWLKNGTCTVDEQHLANPNKPFPDEPFVEHVVRYLLHDRGLVKVVYKSRTMMGTWLASGAASWLFFKNPHMGVVYQSKDHERSIKALGYSKTLWKNSRPKLRERWKLSKPMDSQNIESLQMAEGGISVAIAGGADKVRAYHSGIYVGDEAALMDDINDTVSNVLRAEFPYIFLVTSARPGPLANRWEKSKPMVWPLIVEAGEVGEVGEESGKGQGGVPFKPILTVMEDDERKREEDETGEVIAVEADLELRAEGKVIARKAVVARGSTGKARQTRKEKPRKMTKAALREKIHRGAK